MPHRQVYNNRSFKRENSNFSTFAKNVLDVKKTRADALTYEHILKANKLSLKSWLGHVKYIGLKRNLGSDYLHMILSSPWKRLVILFTFLGISFTMIFALVFYATENSSHSESPIRFFQAWNLSVQTFLTIGYGVLSPTTDVGNLAVFLEVFGSMTFGSLLTGLVFLKFSQAKSPVVFGERLVVTSNIEGEPILKIRLCLSRNGALLLKPTYSISLVVTEESFEGSSMIRLRDMELETNSSTVLNANMNLVHKLDMHSPLYKHWVTLCRAHAKGHDISKSKLNLAILVTCDGIEDTFQADVRAETIYYTHNLSFDHDFEDMFTDDKPPDGYVNVVNILKLDHLKKNNQQLTDQTLVTIFDIMAKQGMLREKDCDYDSLQPRVNAAVNNTRSSIVMESAEVGSRQNSACSKRISQLTMGSRGDDKTLQMTQTGVPKYMERKLLAEPGSHTELEDLEIAQNHKKIDAIIKEENSFCGNYCRKNQYDVENDKSDDEHKGLKMYMHSGNARFSQVLCHGSTWYWYALQSKPSHVLAFLLLFYACLTSVFTILILLDSTAFIGDGLYEVQSNISAPVVYNEFSVAFYFATQTLSTVGYGALSPKSDYANWVVCVAGFFGWLGISTLSGITWSRFAKAQSRMIFSKQVVITSWNGERVLLVRVAGLFRAKPITECSLTGSAVLKKPDLGYMKSFDLQFIRATNPIFNIPGTFMHIINEASPLHDIYGELEAEKANLILSFVATGFDSAFKSTVYSSVYYLAARREILFGYHYHDMISFHNDYVVVDMHYFHKTQKDPPSFLTYITVRSFFRKMRRIIHHNKSLKGVSLVEEQADKLSSLLAANMRIPGDWNDNFDEDVTMANNAECYNNIPEVKERGRRASDGLRGRGDSVVVD